MVESSSSDREVAHGWAAMDKAVRDVDEHKVRDCKEDIDTILVFAGLFSAVLTAFLIESYHNLQQDPATVSVGLLQQIATQTSSYRLAHGSLNSTEAGTPPTPVPFQPSVAAIRVNVLWFASLTVSLISASFGILVKQWLREYLAGEYTSSQARLRIRHYRNPGLYQWKVFEIAAVLPLLLQLSLGLFFTGLCFFTADVHQTVGHTTLPLVAGWAVLIVTATLAPVFFPRCPYKTTLLKDVMVEVRRCRVIISRKLSYVLTVVGDFVASCFSSCRDMWQNRSIQPELVSFTAALQLNVSPTSDEEEDAVTNVYQDTDILVAVDAIQSDDYLLATCMHDALRQSRLAPAAIIDFVMKIINNRLQNQTLFISPPLLLSLKPLPRDTWNAVMDIVAQTLQEEVERQANRQISDEIDWQDWMRDTVTLLFSKSPYPLPRSAQDVLASCLSVGRYVQTIRVIASRVPPAPPRSRFAFVLERLNESLSCLTHTEVSHVILCLLEQYLCDSCGYGHQSISGILQAHESCMGQRDFEILLQDIFLPRLKEDFMQWTFPTSEYLEVVLVYWERADLSRTEVSRITALLLNDPAKAPMLLRLAAGEKQPDSAISRSAALAIMSAVCCRNPTDRAKILGSLTHIIWQPWKTSVMYSLRDAGGEFYSLSTTKVCCLCLSALQKMKLEHGDPSCHDSWQKLWETLAKIIQYQAISSHEEEYVQAARQCIELLNKMDKACSGVSSPDAATNVTPAKQIPKLLLESLQLVCKAS